MSNGARRASGGAADAVADRRLHIPAVSLPERVHPEAHMLLWQVRGESDVLLDDEPAAIAHGHALWVPAGIRHTLTVHANSVLLPMFFLVADTATTLDHVTVITVDRDLRTLFLAFVQSEATIIRPAANLARQILSLIEDEPVLATALPMPVSPAARAVAETLRFNPGDDRGVDQLAESVHTSTRTLERAFLAEAGTTLRRWRIRNRLEAAAILLRTATSVEAVAHRVGYADVSAFRRVFKAHFGTTPSGYAARYGVER